MEYSFASAEIFLSIAQSEYQNEHGRTSIIDSKLAIALPIIATYFFLAVQFSSFREIFGVALDTQSIATALMGIISPISYFLALCGAAISLVLMVFVVATRSYQTVDPKCFNTAEQMSLSKKEFSAALATFYIRATDHNRTQNDKRVKKYKWGWITAAISLGFFVIHVILSR